MSQHGPPKGANNSETINSKVSSNFLSLRITIILMKNVPNIKKDKVTWGKFKKGNILFATFDLIDLIDLIVYVCVCVCVCVCVLSFKRTSVWWEQLL